MTMDLTFIYDMPTLYLGLGFKVLFIGLSVALLIATRGIIARHLPLSHDLDQSVSAVFGAIGMIFGLFLGLIAVETWENRDKLDDLISQEASSIIQLYRSVSVLNNPSQTEVRQEIRSYTQFLVDVAWPAYKRGEAMDDGEERITAIHQKITAMEKGSLDQDVAYEAAVSSFATMAAARSLRIDSADISIPEPFWFVIMGGSLMSIPILYFLKVPSLRLHVIFMVAYSFYLSGIVTLIAVLDHPMRGSISASSAPLQRALKTMTRIDLQQTLQTTPFRPHHHSSLQYQERPTLAAISRRGQLSKKPSGPA